MEILILKDKNTLDVYAYQLDNQNNNYNLLLDNNLYHTEYDNNERNFKSIIHQIPIYEEFELLLNSQYKLTYCKKEDFDWLINNLNFDNFSCHLRKEVTDDCFWYINRKIDTDDDMMLFYDPYNKNIYLNEMFYNYFKSKYKEFKESDFNNITKYILTYVYDANIDIKSDIINHCYLSLFYEDIDKYGNLIDNDN